jgi:hypothetical protein
VSAKKGKGSAVDAAARQAIVKASVKANEIGQLQDYAENVLGVSRWTLYRDLEAIGARKATSPLTPEERLTLALAQFDVLSKLELATIAGVIPPDVTNAVARLRDQMARLLDMYPDSRSTRLNLNVHVDGTGRFHETVSACAGLDDQQYADVLAYAKSLQRKELPMPEGPPLLLEAPTE